MTKVFRCTTCLNTSNCFADIVYQKLYKNILFSNPIHRFRVCVYVCGCALYQ